MQDFLGAASTRRVHEETKSEVVKIPLQPKATWRIKKCQLKVLATMQGADKDLARERFTLSGDFLQHVVGFRAAI